MATFAERFRIALKRADLTAAELSRMLNIPEGTLSQYKSGAYEPKQRRLEKIAKALNVSIPWLMGTSDIDASEEQKETLVNNDAELTEYLDMLANRDECRMLFHLSKDAKKEDVELAVKIIEDLRKRND